MLRTKFLSPVAALNEGWERANGLLAGVVSAALKAGQGGGFADAPRLHEACRAAVELLAQGDREGARDLIRTLARARQNGHAASALDPSLERLVGGFTAWTGDAEFLARYQAGLTGIQAVPLPPMPRPTVTDDTGLSVVTMICERWGLRPDAPAGALHLAPLLEEGWSGMALLGLRIGTTTVDLRFQRHAAGHTLKASRASGPRLSITVWLEQLAPSGIWIDDEPLGGQRAVFDLAGEHELRIDL